MKKTWFVPLCVLSALFIVSGIFCAVCSATFNELNSKLDQRFQSRNKDAGSYRALYEDALSLRLELSRTQNEGAVHTATVLSAIGVVLLGWALDRRRLVRRVNMLAGPGGQDDIRSSPQAGEQTKST